MRFALIGLGGMGSRWAGVIPDLSVIVDPKHSNVDLEDVLKDESIKAVVVAVPHNHLAGITRKCLRAGKHVLCEKPGGLDSKEVKRNIKIAKDKRLIYMVGFNHRFHDGFIKTRKLIKEIGRIIFIRAKYGFGGRKGYDKEWRINNKLSGGGQLHDQGVHMIDLATSFIGKPVEVKGFTSKGFWGRRNKDIAEDNGFVLLKGKDGAIASIHASLTQWDRTHLFEIYGTKGYMCIRGLGQRYSEDGEWFIYYGKESDWSALEVECDSVADHSLSLELTEFMKAIKQKRQPVPSAVDAYETLKIVEEVYKQNK